jgi:hypothetical protein
MRKRGSHRQQQTSVVNGVKDLGATRAERDRSMHVRPLAGDLTTLYSRTRQRSPFMQSGTSGVTTDRDQRLAQEIHTAVLMMMESGFPGVGASSFERAARIEVCPSISGLAPKDTQMLARGDLSNTHVRRSAETYPIPYASVALSLARDHFPPDCKRDSIPI